MLRRVTPFAYVACLLSASSVAAAADPGEAAVAQCFELRDRHPAAAVEQARAGLRPGGLVPEVEIKLRTCLGRSLALTGDAAGAEAEVARVDALLARHPLPPEFLLRALSNAGATLHTLGFTHRALDYYDRAYEAASDGDSDLAQAATLINVASIHSESLGAHERAEALFAEAEAAQARAGEADPLLPYNRGLNQLRMGHARQALARFEEAERIAVDTGHAVVAQRARAERIALQAPADAPDEAFAALAGIARGQLAQQDPSGAATTLLRLSALALRSGDAAAALAHADEAAALVDGPAFRGEQRDAQAARVVALAAGGEWRAAYEGLETLHRADVVRLQRQSLDTLAGLQARLHDTQREREFQQLQDAQRIEMLRLENARRLRNLLVALFVTALLLGGAFAWYQRGVNRRLSRLSRVDPLTGLLNRRAASLTLEGEGAVSTTDGARRDVVFLIDIDHFKARNDRYGHAAGDAALAEVAQRLRACCRPEDIVARWGGEEFLVGCRQLDLVRAQQVAERLRSAAAGSAAAGADDPPRLSVSIGFACFPFLPGATAPGGWQDAIALADRAMYAAKHGGRDAWVGIWGEAGREASIASVLHDPGAHADAGDMVVVTSRAPVRWQAPAG